MFVIPLKWLTFPGWEYPYMYMYILKNYIISNKEPINKTTIDELCKAGDSW